MSTMNEILDQEVPMPYVRRKPDYKADEVKYTFEKQVQSLRTTTKTGGTVAAPTTETYSERVVETKIKKVTLKTYGQSSEEDSDHFFEAWERFRSELEDEWEEAAKNKANDAKILFNGFDKMLIGTASAQWSNTLGEEQKRDWETFKVKVSEYITTKVLSDDAYNLEVGYLQERTKPMALLVKPWWLRMQTLNRRLPFYIRSMAMLKRYFPDADFKKWWTAGSLADPELKRIVTCKVPGSWQKDLKHQDLGHTFRDTKTTDDLIEHFTVLETLEREQRNRARVTPRGRGNGPRGGRYTSYRPAGPGRQSYQGRSPTQSNYQNYQQQYRPAGPRPYYNTRYQQRQQQSTQAYAPRGGRGGYQARNSSNYSGRFGGQRTFYRGGQQQSNGRGGGRSEAHFQEQEFDREPPPLMHPVQYDNEPNHFLAEEEELIDAWNESLYLDAPDDDVYDDRDEHQQCISYDEPAQLEHYYDQNAYYGSAGRQWV